jgi:predicted nuclease of predicted toxin-antitoxin system
MPREARKQQSIRGFVLDEHINRAAIDALIRLGWRAAQPGYDPLGLGAPPKGTRDPELVLWSARHNFCFVTKDQQFGDAGAVPSKHAGVVILVCEADAEVERIEFIGRAVKRQRGQVHGLRFALGMGRMAYLAKDGSVDTLPDGTPWIFDI